MSPKKSTPKSKAARPDWSRKIQDFRIRLKLTRSELGKRLGASAMAVSRWERGTQEVPANFCIQIGNMAGDPLCWYFWGRSGLRMKDVLRVGLEGQDDLKSTRQERSSF
jgi:DNA-binding XRE family transcriptional regulator